MKDKYFTTVVEVTEQEFLFDNLDKIEDYRLFLLNEANHIKIDNEIMFMNKPYIFELGPHKTITYKQYLSGNQIKTEPILILTIINTSRGNKKLISTLGNNMQMENNILSMLDQIGDMFDDTANTLNEELKKLKNMF